MNRLSSITVENYRAFKNKHTIELKNLTLLFGYNNTGKSSLIRLFPLLKDSFKKNSNSFFTKSYLDYSSSSIRGALFNKLVNGGEAKLSFGLKWENNDSLDFSLKQNGLDPEVMTSLRVCINNQEFNYQQSIDDPSMLENKKTPSETISFYDFKLPNNNLYNELIHNFSNSVFWISSTRIHPPRKFEVGLGIPITLEPNGDGIGPLLWHLYQTGSPSLESINNWLYKTCDRVLDFKNTLGSSDGRQHVSLETVAFRENSNAEENTDSLIKTPILDSGEGIAQALPVAVISAMAANGELGDTPIIVIEQPELHLHPQAAVELAKFITTCINKNKNARFILETHSESFLRSLQIGIIEEEITPNELSCYWISKKINGSKIVKVDFDRKGYISNSWPQNVFRENLNQAKEIVELREKMNKES